MSSETAEEIRDGILALVKKEVGSTLVPEDAQALGKWALDYGKLAIKLEAATSDAERDSIRHEIQGTRAIIKNEIAAAALKGGNLLKSIAKGAFSIVGTLLESKLGGLLGGVLANIKF